MRFNGIHVKRKGGTDNTPIRADSVDSYYDVSVGGQYRAETLSFNTSVVDEHQLITLYRQMAQDPEIENALDDIIGDMIIFDKQKAPISLNLDSTKLTKPVKNAIHEEFRHIANLMRLNVKADDYAKKFYVDGRLKFHLAVDKENLSEGIQEIQYIDPRKLHKVREVEQYMEDGEFFTRVKAEYYVYSTDGFGNMSDGTINGSSGYKIAPDSIVEVNSGKSCPHNKNILSHLHPAIKPLNVLNSVEDATVIHRISRAPERRVFYVDVGTLPPAKAEQYIKTMAAKHKNRAVYDAQTGRVSDNKRHTAVSEDYWLARREGGKGTEIDTLPGGENLRDIDNINYFNSKLYRALKIPVSRTQEGTRANYSRESDVARDEYKFGLFIGKLRTRFSDIFNQILRIQLPLRNIMTMEEWDNIVDGVNYDFIQDNQFTELTQDAIMEKRFRLFSDSGHELSESISKDWARRNILRQTDQEIEEIDKQIEEENASGGDEDIGNSPRGGRFR